MTGQRVGRERERRLEKELRLDREKRRRSVPGQSRTESSGRIDSRAGESSNRTENERRSGVKDWEGDREKKRRERQKERLVHMLDLGFEELIFAQHVVTKFVATLISVTNYFRKPAQHFHQNLKLPHKNSGHCLSMEQLTKIS